MERPQQYRFHQGDRVLPFAASEYDARLGGLRTIMDAIGVEAVVLTSMHNIAYYSGFLHCSFGRPYAPVVTASQGVIPAGIDAGQPWRCSHGDNITYTDWSRDNYWHAILSVTGPGKVIGHEADHLTLVQSEKLASFLTPAKTIDIAPATMTQRMMKSPAEIALIRPGAGGYREHDIFVITDDAAEDITHYPMGPGSTWRAERGGIRASRQHLPAVATAGVGIEPVGCYPLGDNPP